MGRRNFYKNEKDRKKKVFFKNLLKGILDVICLGMGFVVVDNLDVDILICLVDFNIVLYGDIVKVVVKEMKVSGKRM